MRIKDFYGVLALELGVLLSSAAHASDWVVRASANGGAQNSGYNYCGSSDAMANCASTQEIASGTVIYTDGNTTIKVQGQAQGNTAPQDIASGVVVSDLASGTIRQSNASAFAASGTSGLLKDELTFALPDPSQVYEIPFSYSFDGGLAGDTVGEFHPGLYAQSSFLLGNTSYGSTQSIGESGEPYSPPSIGSNGNTEWTDVRITQETYGYSLSAELLVGGDWGNVLTFDMQSSVSCGNEYGTASCDYGHTQKFDFGDLPSGVSYTSASGVFLTADTVRPGGVPEPSTWLILLGGFGLTGATLRARKTAQACRPA